MFVCGCGCGVSHMFWGVVFCVCVCVGGGGGAGGNELFFNTACIYSPQGPRLVTLEAHKGVVVELLESIGDLTYTRPPRDWSSIVARKVGKVETNLLNRRKAHDRLKVIIEKTSGRDVAAETESVDP